MQHTRIHSCNRSTTGGIARKAFSLIELVVVVVIIGIIAAIAIPKMSKGAQGAADGALTGDLKILRQAVDMYVNEHGGAFPDAGRIGTQLTQFTNSDGTLTSPTKDTGPNQIIFGPYIRAIPPVPVGPAGVKNLATIGASNAAIAPGWFFDNSTGTVTVNTGAGNDSNGIAYSTY